MNRRHSDYKSDALPTELHRLKAAFGEKAAASENTTKSNYFVQAERLEKFCLIIKNNYWGLFNQKVAILMPEMVLCSFTGSELKVMLK